MEVFQIMGGLRKISLGIALTAIPDPGLDPILGGGKNTTIK